VYIISLGVCFRFETIVAKLVTVQISHSTGSGGGLEKTV
jgi:hypothetical protein